MNSRFSQQADLYARYRPDYPEELHNFILSKTDSLDTAWDCGTGSGQVARVLANHFKKVYASDISQQQMEHAPKKENIQYFNIPAEDTGFAPNLFNLVTVGQAIHWFNFESFYEEVNRTAKKDALLAVFGYGMVQLTNNIDDVLHSFYDEMFSRYFSKSRKYINKKYRTIPFPFDEISSPDFERNMEWTLETLEGFLNSWSTVQKYKNDHNSNPVDPVLDQIKSLWESEKSRTVTFPVFLRLGQVK